MAVITATTNNTPNYTLGIDIGSTTVKIAILDESHQILFADYERHFANIQETLASLLSKAIDKLGEMTVHPVITGSGGLGYPVDRLFWKSSFPELPLQKLHVPHPPEYNRVCDRQYTV